MPFPNPLSVEDYENGEGYYKYQNQTNYYRHAPGTAQPAIVGYR